MSKLDKSTSKVVDKCQISGSKDLKSIVFLGYHPPVNDYVEIGSLPEEKPSYPCELLYCEESQLVQLGLIINAEILFPKEYPYTSSTTKILRENFKELYLEANQLLDLNKDDLIIDIGSNDGNLLSNFKENHRVLGVTPEEIGNLAIDKGIPTIIDYFNEEVVEKILVEYGKARVITATNVFAHIDEPNKITNLISKLLTDDGVFISESHYLASLVETLQYDTIYHEHLRYYSLSSLNYLLEQKPAKLNQICLNSEKCCDFNGQWIGLLKANTNGSQILKKEILKLSKKRNFKNLGIPDLFSSLIKNKIKINVLYVAGQWLDVNDAFDLAEARKISWAKNFN